MNVVLIFFIETNNFLTSNFSTKKCIYFFKRSLLTVVNKETSLMVVNERSFIMNEDICTSFYNEWRYMHVSSILIVVFCKMIGMKNLPRFYHLFLSKKFNFPKLCRIRKNTGSKKTSPVSFIGFYCFIVFFF